MFNGIINAPNRVRERQIALQNERVPTYLKGNKKYYFRAYLVLFSVSFLGSGYELSQFIRGKAKKAGE